MSLCPEHTEAFETSRPLTHAELIQDIGPVIEATEGDTAAFAKVFMPHRFERPFDPPYKEIFKILDDDSIPKAAIAAPRGTGKTSVDAIAFPARKICMGDCKFVVVVSATHGLASKIVKQLGRELDENPNIRKVFGSLKGSRWAEGEGDLRTSTGISILARGAGQQVRGLLEDARPDLIIIDDLEDSEPFRIGDPAEYVRKTWEWLRTDLLGIVDRYSKTTRIVYLGTILGENSILSRLLDNPNWVSTRLELCDDNYTTNFPGLISTKDVIALAKEHEDEGDLDYFYREYRNLPIAGPSAVFTKSLFKYWDQELLNKCTYLSKVVIVDPAKTVNMKSAFSAINGIGFSSSNRAILQLDCENIKVAPDQLYEAAYLMARRIGATAIACETTSLELFIQYPFDAYLRQKGYPPMIPLKARGKKPDRIRELSPLYRMGLIYHHPDPLKHGPLESQLLTFARSKFWDVMDCWAYMIQYFNLKDSMFVMDDTEESVKEFEDALVLMDKVDQGLRDFEGFEISP